MWDSITIELKAVLRNLRNAESVQLFDYMKYRNDRLGLLVNMGLDRVQVQRVAYEPHQTALEEDWHYWSGRISGRDRELGAAVCDALQAVYREHQTGYGAEVVERLILFALCGAGLELTMRPVSAASYHGVELHQSPLDCIVIGGSMLLVFSALHEDNRFNISRGKSYLKSLDLNWGIAANFGKTQAQFTGLHRST